MISFRHFPPYNLYLRCIHLFYRQICMHWKLHKIEKCKTEKCTLITQPDYNRNRHWSPTKLFLHINQSCKKSYHCILKSLMTSPVSFSPSTRAVQTFTSDQNFTDMACNVHKMTLRALEQELSTHTHREWHTTNYWIELKDLAVLCKYYMTLIKGDLV